MSLIRNIAIAGAGCGVAIYLYTRKMQRTKANLIVTPEVSIYSISLTGLVLRADVNIKNPESIGFSIRFPFIKLLYKGELIGSSKVVDQVIPIKAYSEARIQSILIEVPLQSVFSVASALINALQSKQEVKIKINVSTEVKSGWVTAPYEDTQEVVIIN